jgi:beta-glucosidase
MASTNIDPKYHHFWLKVIILFVCLPFTLFHALINVLIEKVFPKPKRWVWDDAANPGRKRIDCFNELHFPANFLWGTATAAHQVEGGNTNNNWYEWENATDPKTGKSRIWRGMKSGKAADHWNRFKEDVQLMKNLGVNSYRFSIEWSKVEPKQGWYDDAVIQHYSGEIDHLIQQGIVPMVTLHHFTQPIWFDELGGWEKEANLKHFIKFCEKVYEEFSQRVPFWCTFNEPTVFACVGWIQGSFPPGKGKGQLWNHIDDAVNVMQNIMIAHVQVYKALKAINPEPKIGIVHNMFPTNPYSRWNPLEYIAAYFADKLTNDLVVQFFRTGIYKFNLPLLGKNFNLKMVDAPNTLDFLGFNYYSQMFYRVHLDAGDPIRAEAHPDDARINAMTDMEYAPYPEGLYYCLKGLSEAFPNIPLYITENGIADEDDSRRKMFLKRYLYAVSRAIKDGVDVRGYFYWTLMDNFEWAFGYDMRFGLYEVDYGKNHDGVNATLQRKLRPGSEYFVKVVKKFAQSQQK